MPGPQAPVRPGAFLGETLFLDGTLWTWGADGWSSDLRVVTVAPFDGGAGGLEGPADGGAAGGFDGAADGAADGWADGGGGYEGPSDGAADR